jgi:ribosomal protein L1
MANASKRLRALKEKIDRTRNYPVTDALQLVKETATAKFDESVDVAINLGVDARKSDQIVRGAVVLPKGIGKTVRVAVFDKGGIVHCSIGRASFSVDDLKENLVALLDALQRAKPASAKGVYFKRLSVSSTMGVGVRVDQTSVNA